MRTSEIRAHQEQNDVGAFDCFVDLSREIVTRYHAAVVPSLDQPLPFEYLKAKLKTVAVDLGV